jgi:AP-1 complex subunit mu
LERISWNKGFLAVVQGISEMGKQSAKDFIQTVTSNKEEDTSKKIMVPTALTNAVSWRKEGIFYKENKIYLDVIEAVNLIVGSNGKTIQSDILGTIKVNCQLSGMPELKLGLNDKVLFEAMKRDLSKAKTVDLEDVKFHQCVQLGQFTKDRTITFTPPDGEFILMTYRLDQKVKPLVHVESRIVQSTSKIEYTVRAKAQFKSDSTASEVQIHVAVPKGR